MLARILIVAAIVFTLFLDLAHEGFRQRTCCHEIYELEQDIELARELLSIEEVSFQSEVFAVLRPATVVPDPESSEPSESAARSATRHAAPPNIAAAQGSNEEVPGL